MANIFNLFIFTLPFLAFRLSFGLKLPELIFMFLLLLSFFYVALVKKTVFYFPGFLSMFLLFVLVCFLSVLLAPDIPHFMLGLEWASGINAPGVLAWTSLIRVLSLFILVLFTSNYVKDKTELERILRIFVYSGVFVGLFSIYQTIYLIRTTGLLNLFISFSATHMGDLPRISGFMSEPGVLSEYLLVSMIITLALSIKYPLEKPKYYVMLLIQVIALFFSFSTRGWIGLALGFTMFAVLNAKYIKKKRVVSFALIATLITGATFTAAFNYLPGLNKISSFVVEKGFLTQGGGIRMQRRNAAIKIVYAHPLLGVGIGNYPYFHGQYLDDNLTRRNPELNPYNGKKTAVSDYYQLFSETGVLGLGLFIFMGITFIRSALETLKRNEDVCDKIIFKGVLSGLFGAAFAYSVGTSIWASIYFWLLIGWVLAYNRIHAEKCNESIVY